MDTTNRNKTMRCGGPTKNFTYEKAAFFGMLAGLSQPELIALPAILTLLIPLVSMYALGCAYHQASYCIAKRRIVKVAEKIKEEVEKFELQSEDDGYSTGEEEDCHHDDSTLEEHVDESTIFRTFGDWCEYRYGKKPSHRFTSPAFTKWIREAEECQERNDSVVFTTLRNWYATRYGMFAYNEPISVLKNAPFWPEFMRDMAQHQWPVPKFDEGYQIPEQDDVELQSFEDVLDVTTAGLKSFERSLWNLKLIAAFALASKFLTARTKFVKFGCVMGLWQLYTNEPPSDQIEEFVRCNINLFACAIAYCHNLIEKVMSNNVREEIELQSKEEDEEETPQEEPSVEPVEDSPEWRKEFENLWPGGIEVAGLEQHRGLLSMVALAIGFLSVTLVPGTIWLLSEKTTFGTALIDLGKNITAKNIVWTEVKKVKDNAMWLLWKCCGKNYIPDEDRDAQMIQNNFSTHMKDLAAYEKLLASDFFGAMRSNRLEVISKGIEKTEQLLSQLAAVKRSQYNLTTILTNIKTGYEDLLEKRLNLITNAVGKQEPVVVHLCGPPGHGKSEFMKNFLIKRLEEKYKISAYFRNIHDEYWSRFAGQQILVWDDIGFKKDGADYAEFCYHTSGAPSSAIGAAIKEKGRPTNPLFIIVTSNEMYLGPQGHELTTPDAFHRRRDVVINFQNRKAGDYQLRTGETIPPNLYDERDTVLTVYRSVPVQGRDDMNVLGKTTEERLWNFIVEKEKSYANHFKRMLRTKPYYKGSIPEDSVVDDSKTVVEYLVKNEEIEETPVEVRKSSEDLAVEMLELLSESKDQFIEDGLVQVLREFEGRTTLDPDEAKRFWEALTPSVDKIAQDPERNRILEEKDNIGIEEQSVNPDQKSINQKKPCILISGPSGVGKTHMANVFCQRVSQLPMVKVQATELDPETDYTGKVVFVDDITMSKEDYLKAIKYSNFYYEMELRKPPIALIFTQNDQKIRHVADESMTTEIRRRSHCVDLSFYWTWMQFFWTPTRFAVEYKEKIRNAESKAKCMNESLCAYFTQYEGKKLPAQASEITSLLVGAFERVYGDEVQCSRDVWTLPLPSEIDFTVSLKRTIKECAELRFSEVFGSIVTGKLYSINNISHKFTASTAMSMVVDIFRQAPYRERESLDDFVISFNEAEITSVFRPPGTAIITTPEGNVGLVWQDKSIRMFKITNDPVELAEQKIDIHRYFDPQVDTIYKRLVSRMCFDPETIANQEKIIEKIQVDVFTSTSVVCKILQSALSVCMIALSSVVPVMMFKDMVTEMEDRNELTYLRQVQHRQRLQRTRQAGQLHCPKVMYTENGEIPIETLEEILRETPIRPEKKREICLDNPDAAKYFAHERVPGEYPILWKMFKEYMYVPITPSLESVDVIRRQSPTGVYGDGVLGEVVRRRAEVQEEYVREDEDNDGLEIDDERNYVPKPRYVDEQNRKIKDETDRAYLKNLEERYRVSQDFLNNRSTAWEEESGPEPRKKPVRGRTTPESAPTPKKRFTQKKTNPESGPEPRKRNPGKKATPESGPEPKKVVKKRIVQEGRIDITNATSTIDEAVSFARSLEGDVYVYGKPNDFPATTGKDPKIAARLTREYADKLVDWAIIVLEPKTADEFVPQLENEIDVEEGEILRIKRNLAKHSYWHYGIVGPSPTLGEGLHLYHVQSTRDEGGEITAHIAVDPIVELEKGWELYDRPIYTKTGMMHLPASDFSFLRDHAFTKFPYNVNNSNCETWALAMRYGAEVLEDAKLQKLPSYFVALLEIASTFTDTKDKFQEIREVTERLQTQACTDPGALSVARDTMPPNAVFISSVKSGVMLSRGIGVRGRMVLINHHTKGDQFQVTRWLNGDFISSIATRVWDDEALDLSLIRVEDAKFPMFKDITSKFMTVSDMKIALGEGTDSVAMLNVPMNGKSGFYMHCSTLRVKGQLNNFFTGASLLDGRGVCYSTKMVGGEGGLAVTEKGDCGSAVILFNNRINKKIVGIHRAGNDTKMYMALVPQEKLLAALKEVEIHAESFEEEDCILDSQCVCTDEATGFPLVGFSKYGIARTRGTKLRLSPISIPSAPCDGEPAILGPQDIRSNGYEPALTTLSNFPLDPIPVDRKELRLVADEIIDYLSVKLRSLAVFTRTEAINGPSKHRYPMAGSLDRKTSPGFPHVFRDRTTTKQSYFKQMVEKDGSELWRVDMNSDNGKKLDRDLSRMLGEAHAGKRPNVVFSYFPKDEVLAKRKIVTPKTRGILASNVPYVIAYRQYFLSLHLRVQELFNELPIKIGIDPHVDWDTLAHYHLAKGNLGFDADAKNWDASVPVEFMEECAYIANQLYRRLDPRWKIEDDVVRSALHSCVEKPFILYNRKVIQTFGGQVSGQPGTAFDNSLINWMLVAIIYKRVMARHGDKRKATFSHFMKDCALSVYGDDMMITMGADSAEHFTIDKYAKEAANFGFTITTADKASEITSVHSRLEEMTFLKRSFKKIERTYVGPIEFASIGKSLKWIKGSGCYFPRPCELGGVLWKVSDDLGLIRDNFENQLVEASLHGEMKFHDIRSDMNRGLREHNMDPITTSFNGALAQAGALLIEAGTEPIGQCGEPVGESAQTPFC